MSTAGPTREVPYFVSFKFQLCNNSLLLSLQDDWSMMHWVEKDLFLSTQNLRNAGALSVLILPDCSEVGAYGDL